MSQPFSIRRTYLRVYSALSTAFHDYVQSTRRGERFATVAIPLRLFLLYGVVIRFGINQADLAQPGMSVVVRLALLSFFVYCLTLAYLRGFHPVTFFSHTSKWCQILLDVALFSVLYFCTQNSKSDFFLLYLLPLLLAADYLSAVQTLTGVSLVCLAFFFTSLAIMDFTQYYPDWWFWKVVAPRVSIFLLFGLGFWVLRRLNPAESVTLDRERLAKMLKHSEPGTYIVDGQFKLLAVSQELRVRHGEDFQGKSCYDYLAGRQLPCSGCVLALGRVGIGQGEQLVRFTARPRKGESYEAQATVCPLTPATRVGAVATLRNTTQRREFELELQRYASRIDALADRQVETLAEQVRILGEELTEFFEAATLTSMVERDEEQALSSVLERFSQRLGCVCAVLRMPGKDPSGRTGLIMKASWGMSEERRRQTAFLPLKGSSPLLQAVLSGVPSQHLDVQDLGSRGLHFHDLAFRDGLHSVAFFPLPVDVGLTGSCSFYRNVVLPFTAHEMALGQAMCKLLAVGLRSLSRAHSLTAEISERQEWLRVVAELSTNLAACESRRAVMLQALDLCCKRLGAEVAAVFLWEDEKLRRKEVVGVLADEIGEESYDRGEGLTGSAILPLDGSLYGRAITSGEVTSTELPEPYLSRYRFASSLKEVRHIAAAPLNNRSQSFGVLRILNRRATGSDQLEPVGFDERLTEKLQMVASLLGMALENTRLFDAERARREQAERLKASSLALASTLELHTLFEQILDQLHAEIPYDSASVQVLQPDGFRIVACRGFPDPKAVVGLVFPHDPDFPNLRVKERGETIIVDDFQTLYQHVTEPSWQSAKIRGWLGAPMIYGGEVIGMIALDSVQRGFYRDEHKTLASVFAAQAAVALNNAQSLDDLRQRNKQIKRLVEIARQLGGLNDPNTVTQRAIELAATLITKAEVCVLHRPNPANGELERVSAWPTDSSHLTGQVSNSIQTLARIAARNRQTLRIPSAGEITTYAGMDHSGEFGSSLVAPMYIGKEKLVGTLSLYSHHLGAFDGGDEEILTMLASVTGAGAANAELWQARERHRKLTESLLEAVRTFDMELGLADLSQRVAQIAVEALGWMVAAVKVLDSHEETFVLQAIFSKTGQEKHLLRGISYPAARIQTWIEGRKPLMHCYWIPGAYRRMIEGDVVLTHTNVDSEQEPTKWTRGDALLVALETPSSGLVGYLALADDHRRSRPSTEELQLLELLSGQAAEAIARARRFQRVAAQKNRLQRYLSLLSPQLASFSETMRLSEQVVQLVSGLLDASEASIWLPGKDGTVRCQAALSLSSEQIEDTQQQEFESRFSEKVCHVMETGQALFLADSKIERRASSSDVNTMTWTSREQQDSSLLMVPLKEEDGKIIGVLQAGEKLGREDSDKFTDDDVQLMEVIASQVMAEMRRIRFREEVATEVRRHWEGDIHEAMNVIASGATWEVAATQKAFQQGRPADVEYGLQRIERSTGRAYQDLRHVLLDLRNPVLELRGLTAAIEDYASTYDPSKIRVVCDQIQRLPFNLEHGLYRIAQEAISNAFKHSGIRHSSDGLAHVQISTTEEKLSLMICDNGRGFDVQLAANPMKGPSGLTRMREWADDAEITLETVSEIGAGTRISASVVMPGARISANGANQSDLCR